MTTLELFMAFFLGFLSHKVWHWLYIQGTIVVAFHEVQKSAINSLSLVYAQIELAMDIKYEFLESIDGSPNRLHAQKNIDKIQIQSMKDSAIRSFTNKLPSYVTTTAKYRDWESAMEYYNERLK